MRIAGAFLIAATVLTATTAQAGSIETLEAANSPGPSIMTLAAQAGQAARPSVITLGKPVATDDKVASSAAVSRYWPAEPTVFRGGVVGGAWASSN
ncbi:hypothetical protein [Mesorhizobium sp. KR1-2]|uniref:hypothetical protein n=1 Tax=Mesorhizobium sp. KR1-2 TaxID=3156609 RepID=UPI0032B601E8